MACVINYILDVCLNQAILMEMKRRTFHIYLHNPTNWTGRFGCGHLNTIGLS